MQKIAQGLVPMLKTKMAMLEKIVRLVNIARKVCPTKEYSGKWVCILDQECQYKGKHLRLNRYECKLRKWNYICAIPLIQENMLMNGT